MKFSIITIALILAGLSISAQTTYPTPSFKSPRETMNYFLKTMKGHKQGDPKGLDLAILSFDTSQLDDTTKYDSARLAAIQLINTLDRLEYIQVSNIPDNPPQNIWVYRQQSVLWDTETHWVEISIAKNSDQQWKFTPNTLKTIEAFYQSVKDRPVIKGVTVHNGLRVKIKNMMPPWTGQKAFILLNGQWIGLLILIFLSLLIDRLARIYITFVLEKLLVKGHVKWNARLKKRFNIPLGIVFFASIFNLGIKLLEFNDQTLSILRRGSIVVITIGCVFVVTYIVDIFCLFLEKKAIESENKFDDILVPLIRKTAKFFVIAIGFIFIGNSLTLDMKSIIAGMGIGGFAFALAAKDTIGNLFGSMTVLLDKPFRIGDWVVINDKIEGTVEEVGIRSTRVRTFYDSQITVPNGQLTNVAIDNYGQRTFRRFNTKIGVQYDTPVEKIESFCEGIRQIILSHPHTRKDYFHVYLNSMNQSSLDILLYVFWAVPSWNHELAERHRLLMDIIRLAKSMGVKFAFPTQSIYVTNQEDTPYDTLPSGDSWQNYAQEQVKEMLNKKNDISGPRSGLNDF